MFVKAEYVQIHCDGKTIEVFENDEIVYLGEGCTEKEGVEFIDKNGQVKPYFGKRYRIDKLAIKVDVIVDEDYYFHIPLDECVIVRRNQYADSCEKPMQYDDISTPN